MTQDYIYIIIGVVGLYIGGKYFVDGAVALSLRYHISPTLVGLLVIALGNSLPELFVSVQSALAGSAEIAYGNVVGSNIANILLILGLPALLYTLPTSQGDARSAWIAALISSLLFWLLVQFSPFGLWQGLVLLAGFALFLWTQIRAARSGASSASEVDETKGQTALRKIAIWIVIGIIALPISSDLLVEGAVNIARHWGLSEAVIGLTIVAVGTSLPELASTVASARRGQAGMALGSALGSCIYDILLIAAVAAVLSEAKLSPELVHIAVPVMVASILAVAYFVFSKKPIGHISGLMLILAYFVMVYFVV